MKAAPRVGKAHGELVCCAGIDPNGDWVRLYPVVFRTLSDAQKFGRWDVVSYHWRPTSDPRAESRRIEHNSLEVVSTVSVAHRQALVARHVVTSLNAESDAGRSLAFVRPIEPAFFYERKDRSEYEAEAAQFVEWHRAESEGLFGYTVKSLVPYRPSPFRFGYKYNTVDGERVGTCQDWEIEAAFLKWSREYGEADALARMSVRFGEEYPTKGFVFAMGTHKAYPQWLINGVVRLDHGMEASIASTLF